MEVKFLELPDRNDDKDETTVSNLTHLSEENRAVFIPYEQSLISATCRVKTSLATRTRTR